MFKNSSKAYRIYRKLTEEEKEILENKKLSGKHSIREWNHKLSHIAVMDAYADKARQGLLPIMFMGGIILIITFFIFLGEDSMVGFVIWGILAAAFAMIIYLYRLFNKINVGNQLRLFVIPTLRMLSAKVGKRQRLEMDLDLAVANDQNYFENTVKDNNPENQRLRSMTTNSFHIPWLKAKVVLADGSLLVWENEDLVNERKVIKRHKGKRKTKYKIKHLAKIHLLMPKTRYQLVEQPDAAIQVQETNKHYALSLKGKEKTIRDPNLQGDMFKSMNPKYFTGLLIKAYQQVEPIQTQTA
ncbi:MAG: hypothetical protein AAF992_15430 [Bacteroidota bacterium]